MCGIAGVIYQNPTTVEQVDLKNLQAKLHHRGPDGFGHYHINLLEPANKDKASVLLLHSRLSILDLSISGHQPMVSHDGNYVLIFNGEIYNYLSLKKELQTMGYEFHSHCDTEVLLNAFCHWGLDVLTKLDGMYAFAVFDRREEKVIIARDCFGIKPLFYAKLEDKFVFASEIKVLLEMISQKRRVNAQALYDYLRFGLTDHKEETMFAGIKQVRPAHYMIVDANTSNILQQDRYWSLNIEPNKDQKNREETFQQLFLNNINSHLQSHVEVGATLSGGLDSSAIVSSICKLKPEIKLKTFSFITDDAQLSEEKWINILKDKLGIDNYSINISPEQLRDDLDNLILAQDEPFGSTTIYAQYRIFKLAHENNIKVMLGGQGADELLGGYHHFIPHRITSMLRQRQFVKACLLLKSAWQLPRVNRKSMFYGVFEPMLNYKTQKFIRQLINKDFMPEWFSQEWFEDYGCQPSLLRKADSRQVLKEVLRKNIQDYGLVHLLRYEDRNAMAFSIENRVPFLTPKLAEFIFSLPEQFIINDNASTKHIFRQAMQGIMPSEVLNRKDKIGFATPESTWLSNLKPWVASTIQDSSFGNNNILPIDMKKFSRYCDTVLKGEAPYNLAVWRCLCMLRWSQLYDVNLS